MDAIKNPFSPGAGTPPPELVGRDQVLEQARVLVGRVKEKRSAKSMILTGLRGVGKTVLLNEMERIAETAGYRTMMIEALENKSLGAVIVPPLRQILFGLDRMAGSVDKAKTAIAVLRSFIGTLKLTAHDVTLGIDVDPAKGFADSGELAVDLTDLLIAVGEAAADRRSAVAIFVDEIQYFTRDELGALIVALHRVQQRQLPVILIAAGLPSLPGLAGESKSYSERLFDFPVIGPLTEADAARAVSDPAKEAGVGVDNDALTEIYRVTKGYPYFLQEWAYQAWNSSPASPISLDAVRSATALVIPKLDDGFFRVRFERVTPAEKRFLRAMSALGAEPYRVSDVADRLGVKLNSLGPSRASLIKKGMIYSPSYGEVAFTVPLFDEFMRRVMPVFDV